MTEIISVSITKEHRELIKREGLSPSRIIQDALDNIEAHKSGELLDNNASLRLKVERLSETIQKLSNFIHERGLADELLSQK